MAGGVEETMSEQPPPRRIRTDGAFLLLLAVIGGLYIVLIVA